MDFISNLLLTVCLGIQVECDSSLFPFSEYKQVSLSFYEASCGKLCAEDSLKNRARRQERSEILF